MIKALRKKFVVVTMLLMMVVFGILFTANYIYNCHWADLDDLQMLEWMSESNFFSDISKVPALQSDDNEIYPVCAAEVDEYGNIITVHTTEDQNADMISEGIIKKILNASPENYKVKSYIYFIKKLSSGNRLILITNTRHQNNKPYRIIADILLPIAGITLLTAISFYLSRYVTEPAEAALIREKKFVSDASHEMKTPLGAISINAQALESEYGEDRHIANIISETKRMDKLVQRLLTLSRLEENRNNNDDFKDFSLSSCVEEIALTYESVAFEKKVEYNFEVENGLVINGNDDEIKQLVAILIDNAIKNTDEMGSIMLRLFNKNHQKIIEVTNTGDGISEDDIPHIFERFYSSNSSRSGNSFGLGLAIAKAITQKHGGEISVVSECGTTCFTVILP